MKQLKIFGVPVASFGDVPADKRNVAIVGSLPDDSPVASRQTKFLSPRYEPSNIATDADVQRVQLAIRQAENGDTQELFRFYRDVLLSDDHIQSCFNTRKLALLAQPLSVMPKDKNNADDVSLAAAMTQAIEDCENWNQGLLAMMDSNGFWPNSIVERLYKPAGDGNGKAKAPRLQYTLRKFVQVNPQLHCYSWAYLMGGVGLGTGSAIQIAQIAGTTSNPNSATIDGTATPESPYRIDLERWEPYLKLWPIDVSGRIIYDVTRASYLYPQRHIIHRGHMLQGFRDNWGGPGRSILMWWLFRNLGRQWFARGMERVGTPWPVAYTDASDPSAVALLEQAFKLQTQIGGLVVDESSRIELKEALVQGMAQGYETFYNICNAAISFHITGLKDSQQPAGMNAGQSNFQGSVREDVRMFDQIMLAETCVKQIAIPFRDINGLKGNVKCVWGGLSDADATIFSELLMNMKKSGLEVADESLPTVNDRTGLIWQRAQAAPADDAPNPDMLSARRLMWLSAGAPGASPVEGLAVKNSQALAQAFRGSLAPVRQIILSSTSRADCEKKLKLFFADWKPDHIAAIVEQAMQVCAATGAAKAVEHK